MRRLVVVVTMLLGAALGATTVLRAGLGWGLALQTVLLLLALIVTAVLGRGTRHWHSSTGAA